MVVKLVHLSLLRCYSQYQVVFIGKLSATLLEFIRCWRCDWRCSVPSWSVTRGITKWRDTCKKSFSIHTSNGSLNGKIMKYTFLKFLFHHLTIKQAVENAFDYWDKQLAPLRLTSKVEQINTEEMGKTQFYTSFINSIVAILSQRLVIQGYYNDTLPDRSKCCKNNRGRFYRDFTVKPSLPASPSLLHWKFILGEWIDKYIKRTIPALRNII